MTTSTTNRGARMAAAVNGLLVFSIPAGFMVVALVDASGRAWPEDIAAGQPTTSRMVRESVKFGLVLVGAAAIAAWRTWVHALQYQSGRSRGWRGVGEAAAVGFALALLYLAPGVVTRPREAPPYVIFYGGAATILGAIVGTALRTSATIVLKHSKTGAA